MKKSKPSLSTDDVKHVATLARLGLTSQELNKFQKQLSSIIDFVGKLNELDTKNVEATSQVTGLENIFREDKITQSLSQEEALTNSPDKYKGYFKVKPVLEE